MKRKNEVIETETVYANKELGIWVGFISFPKEEETLKNGKGAVVP